MWGPIPNSSAPTVISIVISLGKQGTVSLLRNKPLRKKVTIGQIERNVCVTQNLYACRKPYNIGCDPYDHLPRGHAHTYLAATSSTGLQYWKIFLSKVNANLQPPRTLSSALGF